MGGIRNISSFRKAFASFVFFHQFSCSTNQIVIYPQHSSLNLPIDQYCEKVITRFHINLAFSNRFCVSFKFTRTYY